LDLKPQELIAHWIEYLASVAFNEDSAMSSHGKDGVDSASNFWHVCFKLNIE